MKTLIDMTVWELFQHLDETEVTIESIYALKERYALRVALGNYIDRIVELFKAEKIVLKEMILEEKKLQELTKVEIADLQKRITEMDKKLREGPTQ